MAMRRAVKRSNRNKRNNRRRRGRSGHAGLVLFLLFAIAAGVIITSNIFVVKSVQVVGNTTVSSPEIISLSGIQMGSSTFRVNQAEIKRKFDGIGKISFEGLSIQMPDTLTIQIRERIPRAIVNYAGLPTILDEYGYAIEQSREMPAQDLPMITGLSSTGCQVGRRIQSSVPGQVEAMNTVITQIYQQQLAGLISELNVSDLDNLYLMARSGMMVKLGDSEKMQDKLIWMNSVLGQLTSDGVTSGVLDVSSGTSGVYQSTVPANPAQRSAESPRNNANEREISAVLANFTIKTA